MNEKEVITKLLAIAIKQQKVIHRLAQAAPLAMVGSDPNEDYLRKAVSAAATNAGVRTPISAFVKSYAGDQKNNTNVEGTYTVIISGMEQADNALKQNFIKTYQNQIKSQKPDLDGKVSVLFA
jgi:hypothetical protein